MGHKDNYIKSNLRTGEWASGKMRLNTQGTNQEGRRGWSWTLHRHTRVKEHISIRCSIHTVNDVNEHIATIKAANKADIAVTKCGTRTR